MITSLTLDDGRIATHYKMDLLTYKNYLFFYNGYDYELHKDVINNMIKTKTISIVHKQDGCFVYKIKNIQSYENFKKYLK